MQNAGNDTGRSDVVSDITENKNSADTLVTNEAIESTDAEGISGKNIV